MYIRRLLIYVCLCLPVLCAHAEQVTAVVTSYNSATLEYNGEGMYVTFNNSNHSKGNVTANNVATMELCGLPKGVVTSVEVWVKSNKNSGAGTMTCTVDDEVILTKSGTFAEWYGAYSTDYVPISQQGNWSVSTDACVRLTISATANTIALQQLVVTYEPTDPEPYCVTLVAADQSTLLCESSVAEGVILPAVSDYEQDWVCIGWTTQPVVSALQSPMYYPIGSTYYPQKDLSLYALYTHPTWHILSPVTTLQNGEYALGYRTPEFNFVLQGDWVSKEIAFERTTFQMEGETCQWYVETIPNTLRYAIHFEGDNAYIRHIASNAWLGYGNNATSRQPWKYIQANNGSVLFYTSLSDESYTDPITEEYIEQYYAYALGWKVDNYTGNYSCAYRKIAWKPEASYWLLFPTDQVPTSVHHTYTTEPQGTDITHIVAPLYPAEKRMENGQIIIFRDNQKYTILGHRIE